MAQEIKRIYRLLSDTFRDDYALYPLKNDFPELHDITVYDY